MPHHTQVSIRFDTLAAVKRLRGVGVEERHAEAFIEVIGDVTSESATCYEVRALSDQVDAAPTHADVNAKVTAVEAELYRALWTRSITVVGIVVTGIGVIVYGIGRMLGS